MLQLSAAMLGDNPEKSKNPLKKAMRRRNAKTVNFAPPTYYEPSEENWSDEGDGDGGDEPEFITKASIIDQDQQHIDDQSQQNHGQHAQQVDESTDQQRAQPTSATIHRIESNESMDVDEPASPVNPEMQAVTLSQMNAQDSSQRSRNGTVRNTDSFFQDQDTKKITLTPKILRNDTDGSVISEQEVKQRPSLDTFDKVIAEDKPKEGKKKEKKGMLSGLFKRKDKGTKAGKSDPEEADRLSEDSGKSPGSKDSMDSDQTPERKPSKLQKAPPAVGPAKP